jgi:hypothetical protein
LYLREIHGVTGRSLSGSPPVGALFMVPLGLPPHGPVQTPSRPRARARNAPSRDRSAVVRTICGGDDVGPFGPIQTSRPPRRRSTTTATEENDDRHGGERRPPRRRTTTATEENDDRHGALARATVQPMSSRPLWDDDLRKLLERREPDEVISLSAAHRVILHRPPGRPRLHPLGASRGYGCRWRTASGGRMTCRNRGCARVLKKDSPLPVCSVACADELRRFCEIILAALDGKIGPEGVPPDLRCLNPKSWRPRLR